MMRGQESTTRCESTFKGYHCTNVEHGPEVDHEGEERGVVVILWTDAMAGLSGQWVPPDCTCDAQTDGHPNGIVSAHEPDCEYRLAFDRPVSS